MVIVGAAAVLIYVVWCVASIWILLTSLDSRNASIIEKIAVVAGLVYFNEGLGDFMMRQLDWVKGLTP